jgi:hypothetical protein
MKKRSVLLAAVLSAAAGLPAFRPCLHAQEPPEADGKNWRAAFGPKEVVQRVRPTEFTGYLANPHRGAATFQRFNGDPLYPGGRWDDSVGPTQFPPFSGVPKDLSNGAYPATTVAYCRWIWSVLEPEKGQYRWDIIDGALKAARERGQTLQVRLQPCAGRPEFPDWFWKTGASRQKDAPDEPDYNGEAYVKPWSELIRSFAARFDGHADLESFDMAYAGVCGEGGGNTTDATAEKLMDVYLGGFRRTQLVAMLGTHGAAYALAKRKDIGWRADSFGDLRIGGDSPDVPRGLRWNHMYEDYPRQIVEDGAGEAWKTGPVTLETGGTVGYWRRRGFDIDFILEWGLRNHCSVFMPKSCAIPEDWRQKIEDFSNRIGYRFVLRQVTFPLEAKPGAPVTFDVYLDNVGCAPIYRPYKLALRFTQGGSVEVVPFQNDIRTWLPGQVWFSEKLPFPAKLKPGVVKVDMAIVDPNTNRPVVRFAVKEIDKDDWHPLRFMDVLPGT